MRSWISVPASLITLGLVLVLFAASPASASELERELERPFFAPRMAFASESATMSAPSAAESVEESELDQAMARTRRTNASHSAVSGASMQSSFLRGDADGKAWFQTFGVGMFVASTGDLATTELGLRNGLVETNPMQRNRAVRIGTHVVVPALLYWATERAHRSGREKTALVLRIAVTVAYGLVTAHNANAMGR